MWRNPRFYPADGQPAQQGPATATSPEPRGTPLGTFPRSSRGGPETELRVSLDSYEGHPYISLRVFQRSQDGQWWPLRGKGLSVRMGEAEGVIAALADALQLAGGERPNRSPDREGVADRQTQGRRSGQSGGERPPVPAGRREAQQSFRGDRDGRWERDPLPQPPRPSGPPDADPGY